MLPELRLYIIASSSKNGQETPKQRKAIENEIKKRRKNELKLRGSGPKAATGDRRLGVRRLSGPRKRPQLFLSVSRSSCFHVFVLF